jgi:putative peptide zinc metalloprotease protein
MQALLSEHWHALRHLRPRLRDGVEPLHRRLRGRSWVLLSDPVSQRFHRMTPEVWRVLSLCDGRRTLDQVWDAACAAAGDDGASISQHELVQLVSSLHSNDLLQTQVSPDAGEVFERFQRQRKAKFKQNWLNLMSLRLPLFHPDAWFDKQTALARALFSLPVALLWLALVVPAAVLGAQHWQALTENLSDRVLSASNLLLLWFVYPVVKGIHEWAHGLAVKARGGTVREIGLLFILFTPVPYVDATSSYSFASKWARAQVAAAGILAELALGAVAVYVWLAAEPGLVTAIAYNVILIAGVSTLLVNGNPLMRYDGYFIATDLLELPNLAQRAQGYWVYLSDRFLFGAKDAEPPLASHGERWILFVYGAIAPVYRFLITVGLIWFVASAYLLLGALMAVMAAWQALVMPVWKAWKHLDEGGSLARRRETSKRRALLLLAGVLGFLGLVPLPFYSVHQGVIWLPDEALVRAEAAGQISAVQAAAGGTVARGEPILKINNLPLQAELTQAAAALAQTEATLRRAEVAEPAKAIPLRTELAARQSRYDEARARVAALDVSANAAGRWVPDAPTELTGRSVKRGELLGYLVAGPTDRVRVAVTQEDADMVKHRLSATPGAVQVRMMQAPYAMLDARVRREVPGGGFELLSPALGSSGGGEIGVDPSKEGGKHSLRRVFDLELQLDKPSPSAVFGDKVWVRFDLGATPLAAQWLLRLRQAFLARLNV